MKAQLVMLFAFFTTLLGCQKDIALQPQILPMELSPQILFECSITGYGIINNEVRYLLTQDGKVVSAEWPENDLDWNNEKGGFISKEDLFSNYDKCSLVWEIDTTELKEKVKLIEATIDGLMTELYIPKVYFYSTTTLSCYHWDEQKQMYRNQLLLMDGRFQQANTTEEARQLIPYLRKVFKR
ncbi:MAG: hypothetical protein H6607_05780 [Flavobacteriales bacterium]|nr:hypothetical protein [Flavobacteriales bacterium]